MDEKILGWWWGGINVFASFAVFAFYIAVLASSVPLRAPQALKNVALLTAVIVGLQNVPMTIGNFQAILVRSRSPLQWRYHPLEQLLYALHPLLPTASVVFTVFFLVTASRLPTIDRALWPAVKRRVPLVKATALLACMAAIAELTGTLYMDIRFFHLVTVPLFLQLCIDGSFLLFFVLIYKAEPSPIRPSLESTS